MLHLGVCSFLERATDGTVFAADDLPLHVTVLGNFRLDANVAAVVDSVERAARVLPLDTVAAGDARFGPDRDIAVTEVTLTSPLRELHDSLRRSMMAIGAHLDEQHYAGDGYRSHLTWRGSRPVEVGVQIILSSLSVVDLEPDGDPALRRVVATT